MAAAAGRLLSARGYHARHAAARLRARYASRPAASCLSGDGERGGGAGPAPPARGPRRREEARFGCPACGAAIRANRYLEHQRKCCPDLVPPGKWRGAEAAAAFAAPRQRDLVRRATVLKYREDLSFARVAELLEVPERRVRAVLKGASKAIPLVADDPSALEVLHEDDDVLVVAKPADLRTHMIHRFEGGSLLNQCIGHLGGKEPHVVHRLDMDTTGVVVFAKGSASARWISEQFKRKTAAKDYVALCVGTPAGAGFSVDAAIARHPASLVMRRVDASGGEDPTAQDALTHFDVIAAAPAGTPGAPPAGACLVLARPQTGRTHQIRVHLRHAGLPILGDPFYGPREADAGEGAHAAGERLSRQALHAGRLTLSHPTTREPATYVAPLPADFVDAVVAVGLASALEPGGALAGGLLR